jgi:hypothetical protein
MRIENGRVPDLGTFGKVCKWLDIDPRPLLGLQSKLEVNEEPTVNQVSAHLKLDQNPKPETVNALAKMILHAAKIRRSTQELPEDGDP